MNANALTSQDHARLAKAVAKCPAGPRFYVVAYVENGVALPCEVDGAICYEAHLTEASARGAADRQNALCAEHHPNQPGTYGVRVAPSGLMCWNHETDRVEVATDGTGSLSWHWDCGFMACAIVEAAAAFNDLRMRDAAPALLSALVAVLPGAEEALELRELNPEEDDTPELLALYRASINEAKAAIAAARGE